MYLRKVISKKLEKNMGLEGHWWKEQKLDPDPLVIGADTDPSKLSGIRNTAANETLMFSHAGILKQIFVPLKSEDCTVFCRESLRRGGTGGLCGDASVCLGVHPFRNLSNQFQLWIANNNRIPGRIKPGIICPDTTFLTSLDSFGNFCIVKVAKFLVDPELFVCSKPE
jgi:hypothetical protein